MINRTEVFQISGILPWQDNDIEPDAVIIELTGDITKVKAFLKIMNHYGIN